VTHSESADESEIEVVETDVVVLAGHPHTEDLAALTAVLAEVLGELAAEQGRRESTATSAWSRLQRGVRTTLQPGPGAWRSFSG
jgi:Acyl-CoA carboxylase epsilon subunit